MRQWVRIGGPVKSNQCVLCFARCDWIQTHYMSRKLNSDESQTTLGVLLTKVGSTTKGAQVQLFVVRNEEVVLRVAAKGLSAITGYVLNRYKSSVSKQDKVEYTIANNSTDILLGHVGKNAKA